jgi:DNA-binding NarL/FixJ family response regulator
MIRVAITDDHPLVLQGIKDMLSDEQDIQLAGSFENASSTVERLGQVNADVLLLDINLPDKDGTELCAEIHHDHPSVSIIALTSFDDVSMVKTMVRHGAAGYLLKTVTKTELIAALHAVISGNEYIQESMREKILIDALGKDRPTGGMIRLTRREKEVLALILGEHTTAEIAKKLYLSPKTVESHRAVLFQKFGVRNVAGLVKQAIEHGLG